MNVVEFAELSRLDEGAEARQSNFRQFDESE
jgi:hypothetical protein